MIIDILRSVDMKEPEMPNLFTRVKDRATSFCERCGSVCDSACRAEALRERAWQRAYLAHAWRQV
jgi:hypothetical protein